MKIAAFNVKNLGMRKINGDVQRNLIKIVSQYSVVVMIEVVDSTYEDMNKFLEELNQSKVNKLNPYLMQCSKPLERGDHKERVVYFYRMDEASVLDTYQHEEGDEDVSAREPFVLWLECPNAVVQNLVLIPVHTKPEDTETELEAVHDVVEAVRGRWKTDNIMILGNFNVGRRYVSQRRRKSVCIRSPPYVWLMDDDNYYDHYDYVNTMTGSNTYYRIVVYGDKMYEAVVPGSAKAFHFQRAYRLSDDTTKAISDLYSVEVELKLKEMTFHPDTAQRRKNILGDFNAYGRYLSQKKRENVCIWSPPYVWLIDDDVDTYNRIVVYGDEMYEAVVRGSAKSFNFQRAYRLSDDTVRQFT